MINYVHYNCLYANTCPKNVPSLHQSWEISRIMLHKVFHDISNKPVIFKVSSLQGPSMPNIIFPNLEG